MAEQYLMAIDAGTGSVRGAIESYVRAVKDGSFPDDALHAR